MGALLLPRRNGNSARNCCSWIRTIYYIACTTKIRCACLSPHRSVFTATALVERTFNALATLGSAEIEDILLEMGAVTMDCEFCNQQYRFERDDLADVLGDGESKTLH